MLDAWEAGPDTVPFFYRSSGYSPTSITMNVCMYVCTILICEIVCACTKQLAGIYLYEAIDNGTPLEILTIISDAYLS